MDELAHELRADVKAFRRRHLTDDRLSVVLERATVFPSVRVREHSATLEIVVLGFADVGRAVEIALAIDQQRAHRPVTIVGR